MNMYRQPYMHTYKYTIITYTAVSSKPEVNSGGAAVASGVASGGPGGGKYVPPNQRGGEGRRETMGSRMSRDGKQVTMVCRLPCSCMKC